MEASTYANYIQAIRCWVVIGARFAFSIPIIYLFALVIYSYITPGIQSSLTCIAQLSAHYDGIPCPPIILTNGSPSVVETHLNSTFSIVTATHQTNITMGTIFGSLTGTSYCRILGMIAECDDTHSIMLTFSQT